MFSGNGIVPVMDIDGNRNGGAWGDGGGWWARIILFALFGWGGNGFGFGGNGGSRVGFTDAAIQRGFDNQAVISKLDGTINDKFCELEMKSMQRTIDEQASQIQALNLAQSQANQNRYLVDRLRPCPSPAYVVPNPCCCNGSGYSYGNGCGC